MRQRSEIMALRIAATRAVCALPETRWRRGGMNPRNPSEFTRSPDVR